MTEIDDALVAPLDDVLSAEHNLLARRAILHCANSSEYPTDAEPGDMVWDIALNKHMQYTTATTGWNPPWGLGWGNLGYAFDNTDHTGISTGGLVIAATPGVAIPAHREIRIDFNAVIIGHGTPCSPRFRVTRYFSGGGADADVGIAWMTNNAHVEDYLPANGFVIDQAPAAATYSYALIAFADEGSMDVMGSSGFASVVYASDIGPYGAPA